MSNPLAAAEVRAAKKYLSRRGYTSDKISPRLFARASKDMDCPFSETLTKIEDKINGNGEDSV
jgi:hypothetical protein